MLKAGAQTPGGRTKRNTKKAKEQNVKDWFIPFTVIHGDYMPHKQELHLPVPDKTALWALYRAQRPGDAEVGSRYFTKVVTEIMGKYVKIPKNKMFTKCRRCTTLKAKAKAAKTKERRMQYEEKLEKHMAWAKREKAKYYKHREKAFREPLKYMSVILDGMDQKKSQVLRLVRETAKTAAAVKLNMAVIGGLSHGHTPKATAFCLPPVYPKDSSLTCHLLSLMIREAYKRNKSLPPVLYVQLDNTTRENKNSTVLAFCRQLVDNGWFRKVINHTL